MWPRPSTARSWPRGGFGAVLLVPVLAPTVGTTSRAQTASPTPMDHHAASPAAVASPVAGGTPVGDGLPGRAVADQGNEHVLPGEPHEPYNSTPPTSGPHFGETAEWGVQDQPIENELQVHNLEHGGVMLQYHCTCPEVVALLETFADPATGYPVAVIAAPYPDMEPDVALTSWGRILELSEAEVTADVVREFVDTFIDQAPERFYTEELAAWRASDAPKP